MIECIFKRKLQSGLEYRNQMYPRVYILENCWSFQKKRLCVLYKVVIIVSETGWDTRVQIAV